MMNQNKKRMFVKMAPRCGKSIRMPKCPDCGEILIRIDDLLYYCPNCFKKVKVMVWRDSI